MILLAAISKTLLTLMLLCTIHGSYCPQCWQQYAVTSAYSPLRLGEVTLIMVHAPRRYT
jgi:hypothetical protein